MRGADYIVKRTAFALVTIFVAVSLNFALFRLAPGTAVVEPVTGTACDAGAATGAEAPVRPGQIARQAIRHLPTAARPREPRRLVREQQPVSNNLKTAILNTLPMVGLGTLFAILVGTLTGVIAAWRRGTAVEGVTVTTALGFYSMPTHWLGLMLVILFAGTLPTGGMTNDFLIDPPSGRTPRISPRTWCCPSLTLGLVLFGEYTLIVRSAMLETLGEDYILTARAKGLRPVDDRPQRTRCATRCCRS